MTSTGVAGGFFQGVLDESRVWNHARTGAQIRTGKNSEAPSGTGLIGHWHLDETSGTSVADSSGNGNNGTAVGGAVHVSAYGFPQDATAPAAVQGLTASAGDGSVSLTWDPNTEGDLAGYNVFRSTSSPVDTGGSPLNGADLLSSPGFTDSGLTNGPTYYYAVVAVDTANNASAPAETSAVPVALDPVLVGAGDIAGQAWTGDEATAQLLDGIPGTVFTLGDNAYQDGTAAEFASYYDPTWGRHRARTRPTPGNHDYNTPNATGYFDYFNGAGNFSGPAGDRDKGYYSYDVAGNGVRWHVVVLNSECEPSTGLWLPGGCAAGSAQEQWLRNDLANALTNNIIALWHKPRYSSTTLQPHMQALWQVLYDYGVDLALGGHWHNYERLAPMDASGVADPSYGVRQFVVGTGGAAFAGFNSVWPASQVRNSTTNGVIKLTLHAASYDWQFIPVSGQTFTDSGTGSVHGPPPDTTAPDVTIVSAVPSSLGPSDPSTAVTWHASEDGSYSVRVGGASCAAGVAVASGTYSTSPANVVTTVDADDLADGANTIRVCVTDAGSNTGSATTTVSKNSTPPAHALSFDGVNDHVTFGQATTTLGASQFTLETWFRRAGAGVGTSTGSGGIASAVPLIAKGRAQQDGSNLDMNYILGIDASSGVLVADFEDAATGANHPVSAATAIPADNGWHHAAASYDGTTWRLYLDGRMDAKLTVGATPRSDSIQHAALGSALDSTGTAAGFFDGALDEVRIWGVARTGAQIRANRDVELIGTPAGLRGRWALNEGAGTSAADSSGNGVVGTLVNGPTWVAGYDFALDTSAPAAPSGLQASAGDTQISLAWNANAEPDVAGYNLYRSTTSPVSTSGTPVNGEDLIGGTSYTDTGLSNGTTYHYALVAVDGANNASGASAEASASPVQGDPVFVGAGDIADCARTQDSLTADLISAIPGTVWTAGDNVYQNGTATEFATCYDPTWGAFKARTRPTPGNHDYGNGSNSGEGYFDYFNGSGNFTGRAGDRDKGYYGYDVGAHWHVVTLNSECGIDAACTMSAQVDWLRGDLAANSSRNVIGIFHRPRWTSGATRPGDTRQQALWQTLYEYGAEVVLSGHDHHYERFAPQDGSGQADANFGVREFVVGTGGAAFTTLGTAAANSQVRNNTTYGVLKLTLHASSYDWQFVPITGQTFTDSGTTAVHAAPNVRPVVDSVTINETAPRTNDTLTSTVTSHDANGDAISYTYQWRRNGVDITGATDPTLALSTAGYGDKGDQITLRVTASDAGGAGAPLTSSAVTVQNTPPSATVSLSSHAPTTSEVLTATATRADADADTVLLTYVWKVNGTVRKTTSATTSLTDTFDLSQAGNGDGGDTVTVEVTPNDGTANGALASDSAVVDPAPAAPAGLTATLSTTAVTLDWNDNSETDLSGYNVYRASSLSGPYTKLNGALLTGSTYADATAPAQATSYYRVTAVDTGGAESSPAATSVQRGIAFRGSSSAQANGGTSLVVSRPSGVVSDDVLLAVVGMRGTPSITPPSGWSLVRVDTNGTALRQATYLRVAQGSEPASYAWGFGSKQTATGAILAYAGVSTSGPLDGSSGRVNASSSSVTADPVTTTVPDAVVIGLFGTATNASISPPAAMTEQIEIAVSGKQKAATEGADALKAATGSTGARVATASAAAVSIGQLVALRPANAVPPQDSEPPTKPASLAATPVSSSQIDLTWAPATDNVGVDHYEVTRGTTVVGTTALTHFSDTGLSPSTSYTYTVKAVDAASNASPASDPASATTPAAGTAGITLRATATAGGRSVASLSIDKPAGTQAGDVLLASLDLGSTATISPPLGWTLVRRDEAAGALTKATYWHLVGPGDPASFVWTFSLTAPATGVILAYSGADSANPVGVSSGAVSSSGTSVTMPSVDATSSGSVLVSLVGFATNTSIAPPAGMTERTELSAGAGQARVTGESSDQPQAAGASGPRTATAMKAAAAAGQLVVVRPAP
jgi:fibronectin type 3 domain-containing protein